MALDAPAPPARAALRLQARDVAKSYGGTAALRDAPLTLEPGRIHALVGENGAGKSTLLKIVGGAVRPDGGAMTLGGAPYAPASAAAARAAGVALIFQELTVCPRLTVAENVFIDSLRRFAGPLGLVSRRRMERAAAAVLDRLGVDIDPAGDADGLDLGQMKCVEIARALAVDPAVILLDESTAFLNHTEVEAVMRAMERLRDAGLAVAFVSHHLDEVFRVADDVTVLKDGRFVACRERSEIDASRLHELMVGRDLAHDLYPPRGPAPAGAPLLTLTGARAARGAAPFDLTLAPGEILGLAGLKRAGGDQIVEALAGDAPLAEGRIALAGRPFAPRTPAQAWAAGVTYVPGDRTGQGLIPAFSIAENLAMGVRPRRGPFWDGPRADRIARDAMAALRIKAHGPAQPVEDLSGGNMQKVLLGKCLAAAPRLLLLNNPTRGVDLGARQEIYRALRRFADKGCGVLLLGEDLPELIGLCDRIAAFRRGALSAVFDARAGAGESAIVAAIT
jgi:ribose transport system ATP-binding protein